MGPNSQQKLSLLITAIRFFLMKNAGELGSNLPNLKECWGFFLGQKSAGMDSVKVVESYF